MNREELIKGITNQSIGIRVNSEEDVQSIIDKLNELNVIIDEYEGGFYRNYNHLLYIDKFGKWKFTNSDFFDEILTVKEVMYVLGQREIKPNQIYRHFKGNCYATLGISTPVNEDGFAELMNNISSYSYVYHTELGKQILIIHDSGEYYHRKSESKDELVVYTPLYFTNYTLFARPKDMFLSKVNKEKYPDEKQEYRMELIK